MQDATTQRLVEGISSWAALESPTNRPAHVERVMALAETAYREIGAECTRPDLGEKCARPLIAQFNGGRGGPTRPRLLILGHLDTVHPVGSIDGPMPIRIADGRLYGPGVMDMKGGNYLALDALRTMIGSGSLPSSPITVLINTDEEIGSPYSRALIEEEARAHDCVLVPEPSRQGDAVIGRFAFARFRMTTHGAPAHAGADNAAGQSAIRAMARLIEKMEGLTDMKRLVSFNVGVIHGGEFVNVVPLSCTAEVLAVANTEDNLSYVRKVMAELESPSPGVRLEVEPGVERPLFLPSEGTMALFESAREIAADLGLTLTGRVAGGGSDGNFTGALGIPTLDGIGVAGQGPHTLDECLEIATLAARCELIGRLIRKIAAGEVALTKA
ncbi:MAG: M20 family metallopeptidase [Rhizobiaceae bacterium]